MNALYALIVGMGIATAPTLEHQKGGKYVITNPLFVPITATIDCDMVYEGYEPVVVRVSARVSEVLYLEDGAGITPDHCKIVAWSKE